MPALIISKPPIEHSIKTKFIYYPLAIIAALLILIQSFKKETTTASATVTSLNCTRATFSGTPVIATAFTGTATVPYTGGSGVAYSAGSAISSTGVTGLTATLQAGTLASGAGSLVYTIAGTPQHRVLLPFQSLLAGKPVALL